MARFQWVNSQYFDDNGDPLISGLIDFFESGTTTRKTTYADIDQEIPNTNPVVLSAAGRMPNVFFDGTAKAILRTSAGDQIEVRDPVGDESGGGQYELWSTLTTYSANSIVEGSDGAFYISLTGGNKGNDPTTDTTNWSKIILVRVWNTNETYPVDALAVASNGAIYKSLVVSNLGNDPISSSSEWKIAIPSEITGQILRDTVFKGLINEEVFALVDLDLDPSNGTIQTKTLVAPITLTESLSDGDSVVLLTTGAFAITWFTVKWPDGIAPVISGVDDMFVFWQIDGAVYGVYLGTFS